MILPLGSFNGNVIANIGKMFEWRDNWFLNSHRGNRMREKEFEREKMHAFSLQTRYFHLFFPLISAKIKTECYSIRYFIWYEGCKMRIRNGALSSNPQWCNVTFNRTNSCADEHVWVYLCVFIIKNSPRSLSLALSLFFAMHLLQHTNCVLFLKMDFWDLFTKTSENSFDAYVCPSSLCL